MKYPVSNAFRLHRVFPLRHAKKLAKIAASVSNAFRLHRVFPPGHLWWSLRSSRWSLQCLSASSGFSTRHGPGGAIPRRGVVSNAFRLHRVFPPWNSLRALEIIEPLVSNAFRLHRVFPLTLLPKTYERRIESPMPFGFIGFFHKKTYDKLQKTPRGLQCLSASSGFSTNPQLRG